MAHVEKHHRKPCARCAHAYARHAKAPAPCAVAGCACVGWRAQAGDRETYRARWIDPAGRERSKTFPPARATPTGTLSRSRTPSTVREGATGRQ